MCYTTFIGSTEDFKLLNPLLNYTVIKFIIIYKYFIIELIIKI